VSAIGLVSQNVVAHSGQAVVQVHGANHGNVSVQSSNQVAITESATANANSGAALSAPGGIPAALGGTAPLGAAAAPAGAPQSVAQHTAGLVSQTTVQGSLEVVATPPSDPNAALTVIQAQGVTIQNGGSAHAGSSPACAGNGCVTPGQVQAPPGSTSPTGTSTQAQTATSNAATQASSGPVEVVGLVAQNVVNTIGNILVTVGGQNRGRIQVIIESITEIFNGGNASGRSGDATASGGQGAPAIGAPGGSAASVSGAQGGSTASVSGAQGGPAQIATSGNAEAKGAQVSNDVDLRASAAVKISGDNRNPITVFLDLFAFLTNQGSGSATSGDAYLVGQSSPSGRGSGASSGGAKATGLEVQNRVNMTASAIVEIEGSNYADIYAHIRFHTRIQNKGQATAMSGNARAAGVLAPVTAAGPGQPAAAGSQASAPSTSSNAASADNGSGSTAVRSGEAVALGNVSSSTLSSFQYAGANAGGAAVDAVVASMGALPPVHAGAPQPSTLLPRSPTPVAPSANTVSQSGNATSAGWETTTDALNLQVAVCSNAGQTACSASNLASLSEVVHSDSKAESGFAGVNITPTPSHAAVNVTPTPSPAATLMPTATMTAIPTPTFSPTPTASPLPVFGMLVNVNLPSLWPGFERLPMPGLRLRKPAASVALAQPFGSTVDLAPYETEEPDDGMPLLPDLSLRANRGGPSRRPVLPVDSAVSSPSASQPIATHDLEGVEGTRVDVHLQDVWPAPDLPPLPRLEIARLTQQTAAPGMPEPVGPIENFLLWAIVAALSLAAGMVTSRVGREWLAAQSLRAARHAAGLVVWLSHVMLRVH
jgi:hypothetical protein